MPKVVEVLKSHIGAPSSTFKTNRPPPPRPKSKKTPSSRSSTPTPATTKESSESAAEMLPSSSSKMAGTSSSSTLKDRLLTETIVSTEKPISSTEAKIIDDDHDDDAMPSLPQCASMELLAHCEAASQSSSHGSLAKTPPKSPETSRTPPSDSVLPRLSAEQVRKLTPPRAAATLNEDASQVRTTSTVVTSASPTRSNPYRSTSGGRTFERPLSELRSKSTTASSRATTTASAVASASASATATAAPSSSDGDTTSASPIASNSMKAATASSPATATATATAKGKQKKGKKTKHATDAETSNVVAASSLSGAVLTTAPATSDAATAAAVSEAKQEELARPTGPGPSHFEPSQSRQQHCGLGGAATAACVDGSAPDSSIDPLFSPYSSRYMAHYDSADGAAPPMSMPYHHYHQQIGAASSSYGFAQPGTMGEGHDDIDDCEPVPRPYSSARPSIAVVDGDATAPSAAPLVSMTQAYANAAVTSTTSTGNENALSEFDQHQQQLSAFGGYSLYEYQHQQFTQAYGYDWNDEALGGQYSSSVTNPPGTLTTSADVVQGSIAGAMPTGKDMLVSANDDDDAVPALESLTLPEAATVTSTMNDSDRPFQQNDEESKQSADGHDEDEGDVDATGHCGPSPSTTTTAATEEEETTVPHNHQGTSSDTAPNANALVTANDDETELHPSVVGGQHEQQSLEAEGLTLGDLDPEPLESAAVEGNPAEAQLQETSASVTEATQQSSSDALFDGSVGVSRGLARLGCSPAHPWAMDAHQHYHGHYQPHHQHQPQEFYGGHYHPSMQHHQQYYQHGQHYGHHDVPSAPDQTASDTAAQQVGQGAAAEAIRDDDEPVEVTKAEDVENNDEPKPPMPARAPASTASCSIATPPHVSDARSTSPSVCSSSGVHGGAHGHGHGHGGHTTPPYYGGLKSYPTCKHAQATLRARYHRQMQQHHHTQQQQHQAVYGQCNPLPCSRSRSCASSSTPRHSHSGVPSCEHSRSVSGRQSPAMSSVSATVSDLHMHQHHQHQLHHDHQEQNAPVDTASSAHTSAENGAENGAENVTAADSLALAGAGATKPASTAVDALVETFAGGVDATKAAASAEHDVQTSPRHNGTDTARVATSGPAGDFYGHMLPNHHHHAAVGGAVGGDASTTGTPSMVATPSVGPPALLDDAMTAPYVSTTASAALRHATLVSDAAVFSNASMDQSMSSPISAQAVFDNAVMDAESSMLYSATNAEGSAGPGAGVGAGGAGSMMFTPFFTSEGFSNDAAAAAMGEVSGAVDGAGAVSDDMPPPAVAPSPFAAASFLEAMGVVVPKGASAAATAVKASPTPDDADVPDSAIKVEATAELNEELKPAVSEKKAAVVTPEVPTPEATVTETVVETTTVAPSKRKIPMPKSAAARLRASASSTPEPQDEGDLKMAAPATTTTTIVAGRRRVVTPTSPVAEGSGYPTTATSGPRGYVQMSYPQAAAQPSTTAYDHQETRANAQPISTGDAQVDSQPQPQSWSPSQAQLPPPPPYHALEGHSGTPSLSASVGAVREDSRSPGAQSGDLHSDYHHHNHEHLPHHASMHHPHMHHDHQADAHAHDHDLHGHEVYAAHDGHHVPEDTSHHEYVTAGVYSSKRTSLQFSPATPAAIDFPLHADHSDFGAPVVEVTEKVLHVHAGAAADHHEKEKEEGEDASGPGPYRSVALDRRAAESPPPASDVSSCSARCYVSSTGQHHHDHAHVQLNVASSTGHFGAAGITGAGAYPHQFHHGQEGHAHDHAQGYLQAQEYDPTTSPAEMGMMHIHHHHHQHHRYSIDANGTPTPDMEMDMASGGLSPCGNSIGFAAADNGGAGGAVSAGSETPEQVQGEYLPLEFYCADGTFDFDAEFEAKKNLGEPPSYEEGVECLKAAGRLVPLPPTEAELELEAQNARRAKRAAARKLQRQKRQERKRDDAAAAKETKEEKSSVVRAFGRLQRSDDDDDEASSDFDDVSGSVSFGSRTPTTVTPTSPAPIQSQNSFGARSNTSVVSSAAGGGKKTVALPQPKSSKAKGASPAASSSPVSSTVVPRGAIPKSKSQSAKSESQITDSSSKCGGEKNDGKKDEKTQQKGPKPTSTAAGRGSSASGGSVLSASFHSAARDKTWASWSSSSAASSADDCDDSLDTFDGGSASPTASVSATASAFVATSAPVVTMTSAEGKAASNNATSGGQQHRTAATQAATAIATAVVSSGSGKMSGSFDRVSSTGEFAAVSDANAPTRASGGAAALPSLTTISFDDDEGLEWQSQRSQTPNSTTGVSGATRRGFTAKASSVASPSAAKMPPRASTVSWALMSEGNDEEDEAYQHEMATMQAIRQEQLQREEANAARSSNEANAARSTPATTPTTRSSISASSRAAAVAEAKSALPPASAAAPGSFAAALLAGGPAAAPAASSSATAKPFSATPTPTSTAPVSPPRAAAAPRQDGKGVDGKKSAPSVASGSKSGGSKKVATSSSTSKMGGKDAVSTATQSSTKPKAKGKFADIPAGSDSRAIFGEGRPQSKKELMVKEKKELMLREKKELMVKQKKELMLKEKKDTAAKKSDQNENAAVESEAASEKRIAEPSQVEQTGDMSANHRQTTTTAAAEAVAAPGKAEGSDNGVCSDLHSAPPSPPTTLTANDAATDAVPEQRTTTTSISPPVPSVPAGQDDEVVQDADGEEDQDRQESKESTSAAVAPATAPAVAPKKKSTGGATSLKAAMAELERQEAAAAAAAAAKKAKKKVSADPSSSVTTKKEKSQPSTKSESMKASKGQPKSAAKSAAKGSGGKGKGSDEFDSMLAELVKATATKKPNGGAGGSSSAPLTGAHHQGAAAEIVDGQAPGVRVDHNAPEFYLSQATACHCQSLACPMSDEIAPVLTSTATGAVTSCVDDCTPGSGAPASALGPRTKALLSALNVRISTISKSPLPRNVHVFVHHFRRAESDLAQKNPNGRVYALHEADKVLQHYALPPIAEALFKHELAEANHDVSDYDAAKMYADECIEIAKEVGAPAQKLQLSALIIAGRSCESLVRPDGARAYAEDAMVLARTTKDLVGETWALSVGALAMELLARFDDCLFLQSRAAALASIAQNERLKFEVGMAAAIADLSAGRYHASVKKFMLMREASSFQTFVDPTAQSRIIGNLGHALSFVDELDEAAAVLNAEAVRAESAGDPFTALTNLSQLGSTLRCGGRIVEATDAHERELRLALRHPQFGRVGEAHGSLAICHRRTGDLQAAKASHERELQAARRSMDTLLETKALVGLAVVALEMHELEPSAAVESLASSLALLERVPDEDRCRYAVKLGCCEIEVRAHEAIEQALLRGNDSEAAMRAMDRRHLPLLTNWLRRVVAVSKLPTGVENAVLTHPQFVVADSDSNGTTCTGGDCQCSHDHGVTHHPEEEKVLNDVALAKKADKEGTKQPSQTPGKTKMLKGRKGTTTALALPQKSTAASAPEASAEKAEAPFPTPPLLTPSMGPASISALACMTNAVLTTPVPTVLERCDIDLAVSFSLPWDSAESMRVYVARKDTSEVTSRVVPLSRKFLALIAATSSKFRQRLAANTGDPPLLPPSYSQLAEVAAKENGDFLSSGNNVSPDEATTNETSNSIEEVERKRLHPMRPEWAYELHRQIIAPIEDLLLLPPSRAAAEADPSGVPIICFIADGLMANVPFPMLTPAHDAPCLIELCAVTTSPSLEALSLLGELNDSVKKLQSALDTKVHQRANASNANASGMGSNTQGSEVTQPTNSTSVARPAKSVAVRWRSSVPLLAATDASVTAPEEKAADGKTETTTTTITTGKEVMSHECVLVDDSVAGLQALPDAADDSYEMSQARAVMKQNINARFDSALRSLQPQPSIISADLPTNADEKKTDPASSVPMKAKLLPSIDVQQRALIKALIGSLDERTAFGELDMWPPPLHSSSTGDVSATGDLKNEGNEGEKRADAVLVSTALDGVSTSRVPTAPPTAPGSLPMSLLPAPTPCGSVPPFVALCPPSSLANDVVVTVDIPTVPDMSEEFVGGLIVGVPAAGRLSASNTSAPKPSPRSSSDFQLESQVTSSPTISDKLAIEMSTPTTTTNNASASTNASGLDSATLLLHEGQPCDPLFDTLRSPTLHGELLLLATPPAALAHRACVFLPRAQLSQRVLHESAATLPRVVLGLGAPRVVGLLWGADEAQLKEPLMPRTVEMVPNAIDQTVPTSDEVKTRALWAEISAGRWIAGEDDERRKEGRATAARGLRRVILRAMDGGTPHWGAVILSGLA